MDSGDCLFGLGCVQDDLVPLRTDREFARVRRGDDEREKAEFDFQLDNDFEQSGLLQEQVIVRVNARSHSSAEKQRTLNLVDEFRGTAQFKESAAMPPARGSFAGGDGP